MTSMSSMWSSFSNTAAKEEKRRVTEREDLKYLYSAFTKLPVLKLVLDPRARRIKDFEEFPFDTAVPLRVFKNLSVLEVIDLDFRSIYGWNRLSEQLKSLTVKRAGLDDLSDLLINIVLDDADRRRRRSAKTSVSPVMAFDGLSPRKRYAQLTRSYSSRDSPIHSNSHPSDLSSSESAAQGGSATSTRPGTRSDLASTPPNRRHSRTLSTYVASSSRARRSSSSSSSAAQHTPATSSSNLLSFDGMSAFRWRFLQHLCVADNGLTSITCSSLEPLAPTLQSLDLSSNLFSEVPDSLAALVSLRALNLSNCMIDSLYSLRRNPLPAITVLNLRGNRLQSLAGVDKLYSLERLDIRANKLTDPSELARLTSMPNFRDAYVAKNPFMKSHPTYRVTIFNLFRQSQHLTSDITIDGSAPTYNERKYLVDRPTESRHIPAVKPLADSIPAHGPSLDRTQQEDDGSVHKLEKPLSNAPTPNTAKPGRKVARRRVVDISESPKTPISTRSNETSPEATFVTAMQSPGTAARAYRLRDEHESPCRPRSKEPEALQSPPVDVGQRGASVPARKDLNLSSEQYRRRIEALKEQYGSRWLSAMRDGEDPFAADQAR